MNIKLRKYEKEDVDPAREIWNSIVLEGVAFPQENILDREEGDKFFQAQTHTGIAYNADNGEIVGLYILHPNNVGRCGHICNASYAVKENLRGQHIGARLVMDCMRIAKESGYKILQFNAVVAANTAALKLYKSLGFTPLGTIPKGFRMKDGHYEDIIPHYISL